MHVDFIVIPRDGRWLVNRGHHQMNSFETKDEALRVADRFARTLARHEHTSVTLQQDDGALEKVRNYPREGFII
jgi:hypothetical protein